MIQHMLISTYCKPGANTRNAQEETGRHRAAHKQKHYTMGRAEGGLSRGDLAPKVAPFCGLILAWKP